MDLPVERSQRREVVGGGVGLFGLHPRQTVTTVHPSRAAFAQAAAPIVHGHLRDRAEHEAAGVPERKKGRDQERHDPQPHDPRDQPPAGHAREGLVGRRHQPPGKGDTLRLVGIEKGAARTPLEDGREFPGEVHRVADAGVHALAANGAVYVRRVAEQERAPFAEMIGDPVVDAISRKPVYPRDFDIHPRDYAAAHVIP